MADYAAYAHAGTLVFAVLVLLHGLVWHVHRNRWSALLAVAYALAVLVYAFDTQLRPNELRAHPLGSTAGAVAMVLITLALINYVNLPAHASRVAQALAIGVAVLVLGLRLAGVLPRIAGSVTYASYFLAQSGLMLWAMRREPRHGHGLVLAALMLYPLMLLLVLAGRFPVDALRYLVIAPASVLGMTILATGLLRAQRLAETELLRRREAEDDVRRLNESLEQRVVQRTQDLHEMVAGLESFNRSVSHDLRGPLGGIAGVSRLAGEAVARGDLAGAQRLLAAITAQAESSSQLVAALLALARVGEVDLAPQPIDLGAFLRETLEQMRLADPASAAVPVEVRDLPTVSADPALLRQVLVNLVGNAMKFSREAASPRVEVGTETDASGATVLYVRDNGIGFDDSCAAGLFEPFQRLHGAKFQGHGIGLSIVKRIVERHGGRVWARAQPGAGATFCFTLNGAATRH